MRIAETVTFGGGALDRAAHLRGRPGAVARMGEDALARVLPMWRGKPLFAGPGALALVPLEHPALMDTGGPEIFLGLDGKAPRFARDLSDWQPAEGAAAASPGLFDRSEQAHPGFGESAVFAELRERMAALPAIEAELAATARALLGWHRSHRFCAACGSESALAEAGWQRRCPACSAQHFPRTDPVVIMLVTHGNRLLLGRAAGWPEGMYSALAGFVEPGETLAVAVRREVLEETGIVTGRVRFLASQPWPYPSSLMLGCQAEAESDAITLDPAELEDARWLSREQVAQVLAGNHPAIRPSRPGAIAGFLIRNWLADRLD